MSNYSGSLLYSICNTLAYGVGGSIFYFEAKRKGLASEALLWVVLGSLFGALVGSRLGSALFVYPGYYAQHIEYLLIPQVGGKTIVGGLIGGYLGVAIAKKIVHFNRSTGDLFAPGIALGIVIGRIGCFLNGCCYGIAAGVPWAVYYKGCLRHPTQIYESFWCLCVFLFLWRIRTKIEREGDLFKIFILLYSFFRFWVEFVRADRVSMFFNLSMAQGIAAAVFLWVAIYFLMREKRGGYEHKSKA